CRAQPRAAVAIDRHARHRVSEAGLERGIARDVVAGGTLREAATDDDIFDLGGIDADAFHRMTQHVRGHRDAVGLVERAPRGARDAGPTVGDDGDVFHGPTPRCRATVTTNSNSTDLASTTWLRPRLACRSPTARPEFALELRPEPWPRGV